MTSPVMNEQFILETLSGVITPEGPNHHCVASMWAILDAYDREVTRENMEEIVATAMNLHNRVNRLQAMATTRSAFKEGLLSPEFLDDNIAALQNSADANRNTLIKHMQTLMECSEDEDPLH